MASNSEDRNYIVIRNTEFSGPLGICGDNGCVLDKQLQTRDGEIFKFDVARSCIIAKGCS